MAIAAIVVYCEPERLQNLSEALQTFAARIEARIMGTDRIAATVEASSDLLPIILKKIQDLPDVFNLELIYVNYEEDLDENGNMPCAPMREVLDRSQ